jgi:hypothetical protein
MITDDNKVIDCAYLLIEYVLDSTDEAEELIANCSNANGFLDIDVLKHEFAEAVDRRAARLKEEEAE